jgi:hypothetical protein
VRGEGDANEMRLTLQVPLVERRDPRDGALVPRRGESVGHVADPGRAQSGAVGARRKDGDVQPLELKALGRPGWPEARLRRRAHVGPRQDIELDAAIGAATEELRVQRPPQ